MRRPQGYAITIDPALAHAVEEDTFTCAHCNSIVFVKPGQLDADACRACDRHICPPCKGELVRTMKCVPFERKLEIIEARDGLLRAMTNGR